MWRECIISEKSFKYHVKLNLVKHESKSKSIQLFGKTLVEWCANFDNNSILDMKNSKLILCTLLIYEHFECCGNLFP